MVRNMNVEQAEKVVRDLEAKRQRLAEAQVRREEERRVIAYDAHADGNTKARARLDKLNAEAATHLNELASVEDAIQTAQAKLAAAQRDEAAAADREAAVELREEVQKFVALGQNLDQLFELLAVRGAELKETLTRIHSLGSQFPTYSQLEVLGSLSLRTAIMRTAWARCVEMVPPTQRRSFAALVNEWAANIENNAIAPRLGEAEEAA
jgi:chromosome segregation ATPase